MKNNLAEILDVKMDIDSLHPEWCKQLDHIGEYTWEPRNYVGLDFFIPYYRELLESINNVVGEEPKNYCIQCHDLSLLSDKQFADWPKSYLGIIHTDCGRKTCITIPILYNRAEPINFYSSDVKITTRGEPTGDKPIQIGRYSTNHPTLVNVSNYHRVRVLDDNEPRILLQLSYDLTFEEIVSRAVNVNII